MAVRHPLVKVGARAKIVIFRARVRTKYVHPVGTVKGTDCLIVAAPSFHTKAFDTPLLADVNSNAERARIARQAGARRREGRRDGPPG
jgi:hypothetical protein